MKKFVFLLALPLLLTACPANEKIKVERFLDNGSYSDDEFSIKPDSMSRLPGSGDNISIMFYVTMTNNSKKKQTYKFSNSFFVRENSGYKYETNVMNITYQNKQELEPDMSMNPCYVSSLPTDINKEKYYLTTTINNLIYKLYLYNSDGSFYSGFGSF